MTRLCASCGTYLTAEADRCPGCGSAEQERSKQTPLAPIAVLVLGLLAAVVGLMLVSQRSVQRERNQEQAVGKLRVLQVSQLLFRQHDLDGDEQRDFAESLDELRAAQLIDDVLASGTREGYRFQLRRSRSNPDLLWMATAEPTQPGVTGTHYYAINQEGVMYYAVEEPFELNDACRIPPDSRRFTPPR